MVAMVVKNLAARAARPCIAHRPEIVAGRDTDDAMIRQTCNFFPQLKCFIIGVIDGRGQLVGIKSPDFGQQFPRMGDRLFLEIIAERKIAEHFKKCVMPRSIADIVEVIMLAARPHTFLAGSRTRNSAVFKAGKHIFERHHPGVDEHQCRVIIRHQWC